MLFKVLGKWDYMYNFQTLFQDFFKEAIDDMAARSLRCIAIAYRSYETEKVPSNEDELDQWSLPEQELVLLAIVGIKVKFNSNIFLL